MRPAMTDKEIVVYKKLLEETDHYLESGCGGTTMIALSSNVPQIDVIETDIDWINKLKQKTEINLGEKENRLRFHHRDLGKVKQWGIPVDSSRIDNWPFFSLGVWQDLSDKIDFVFVDGRFRVATTLAALLMASEEATIMLHDFKEREHYNDVLEFADVKERVDTAIVLKRSNNFSSRAAMIAWSRFMHDAR